MVAQPYTLDYRASLFIIFVFQATVINESLKGNTPYSSTRKPHLLHRQIKIKPILVQVKGKDTSDGPNRWPRAALFTFLNLAESFGVDGPRLAPGVLADWIGSTLLRGHCRPHVHFAFKLIALEMPTCALQGVILKKSN